MKQTIKQMPFVDQFPFFVNGFAFGLCIQSSPRVWAIIPTALIAALFWSVDHHEKQLKAAVARRADIEALPAKAFSKLLEYAKLLRLSVSIRDNLGEGTFVKLRRNEYMGGAYVYHSKGLEIWLEKRHEKDPVVLAHELGHHVAMRYHFDFSEEGADREADKILRQVLTRKEVALALEIPRLVGLLTEQGRAKRQEYRT